jgi:hypothetical protein
MNSASMIFDACTSFASTLRSDADSRERSAVISVGAKRAAIVFSRAVSFDVPDAAPWAAWVSVAVWVTGASWAHALHKQIATATIAAARFMRIVYSPRWRVEGRG